MDTHDNKLKKKNWKWKLNLKWNTIEHKEGKKMRKNISKKKNNYVNVGEILKSKKLRFFEKTTL